MSTPDLVTPRVGPCTPWITSADVIALSPAGGDPIPVGLAAQMATVASETLYALSARQFSGPCGPVKVRPLSRPTDVDTRYGNRGIGSGYLNSGQYGSAWGMGGGGGLNRYGSSSPPQVDLGAYPVTAVEQVKIDGVIIPSNEYLLEDYRILVRLRPSASATPTERWGWPVNQILDLPDTQPGTFSVTYYYGRTPPEAGKAAAAVLAYQLCLDAMGDESALPARVTSVTRQGVTVQVTDVIDIVAKGLLGIWAVDVFLKTWNPTGARLRPAVWSPDVGRPRRYPR